MLSNNCLNFIRKKRRGTEMDSRCLLFLSLWTMAIGTAQGCPEPCNCMEKFSVQLADCASKDLLSVPVGLPSNVTSLSLSANKIQVLKSKSFINVTLITSLWLGHNAIVTVQRDTLAPLVNLRNLDISYNKIVNFPWEDLVNLTALQLLKMNNNEMVHLPKDAFLTLRELRSLRLNSNMFATIAQGTFESLSLSHLQIYNNPFTCSCSLEWLRDWIKGSKISVPEKENIACELPENLKGVSVVKMPNMDCKAPTVSITYQPNWLMPTGSTYVSADSGESGEDAKDLPLDQCGISDGTQYMSNHAFNNTLDQIKQNSFEFGVIALEVSETEAKVQLNPLQMANSKTNLQMNHTQDLQTVEKEPFSLTQTITKKSTLDRLHLCVSTGNGHLIVGTSTIREGINAYRFGGLQPGTTYTLCLSDATRECQVQVVFTTRKKFSVQLTDCASKDLLSVTMLISVYLVSFLQSCFI